MLIFKSLKDLEQLAKGDPYLVLVEKVVSRSIGVATDHAYNPDEDGYVVLIQPRDVFRHLPVPFNCRLDEILWEGVTIEHGVFHAVSLCNNQFCMSFLIPDAPWVSGKLRAELVANLST